MPIPGARGCKRLTNAKLDLARQICRYAVSGSVGLEMLVRLGDRVQRGQPLVRVFAHAATAAVGRRMIEDAITISEQPSEPPKLIVERIEPSHGFGSV